jgi:hypothetical protein
MIDNWFIPDVPRDLKEESTFTVRLLGGSPPNISFFQASRLHCISIEPNKLESAKQKFYHCHKSLRDGQWVGDCILCKHYNDFSENGKPRFFAGSTEDFKAELAKLKPIEKYFYNIIVRGQEDDGPKKWTAGRMLHHLIISTIAKGNNVLHLLNGQDLKVKVDWAGEEESGKLFPRYSGEFQEKSKLGTQEQISEWMENRHDLKSCRVIVPDNELLMVLEMSFGDLRSSRKNKHKFRLITDPFVPEW